MSQRTLTALLARGIDSSTAKKIISQGKTVKALKILSKKELLALGLSDSCAARFIVERRDPIPADTVVEVLFSNRSRCCVCRSDDMDIILHHIDEYSSTKDHSLKNLAVLCLRHHGEVHTQRELSRNLDSKTLRKLKKAWEAEVASLDTRAILSLANADRDTVRFDYINHFRIFEMAQAKHLVLSETNYYDQALRRHLIEAGGNPVSPKDLGYPDAWQRYDFADGMFLYPYVFEVVKRVLKDTPIINVSDHLDRGWLRRILRHGDIICLQGAHTFKRHSNVTSPQKDKVMVTRKLKDIEFIYSIDLWDSTSNSARGVHLTGRKSAMSLAKVKTLNEDGPLLSVTCSAIAIGSGFESLKTRDYSPYAGSSYDFEEDDVFESEQQA
jgi:hypothetical protein